YSDVVLVASNDNSPFGAGWSLSGLDRLYDGGDNGVMIMHGDGSHPSYYPWNLDAGAYQSTGDDFGTLGHNGTTWTYTNKYGTKWNFNSSGYLTTVVEPHGLAITYTYNGSNLLTSITRPDGTVTTINYSGSLVSSIVLPGSRTMTLSHTSTDLTGI